MALVNISYAAQLDPASVAGIPNALAVGGATNTLRFTPALCNFTALHTAIRCNTSAGGGTNLRWSVLVNNVSTREPFTSYAPPLIAALSLWEGAAPALTANPLGGTTLRIEGANFGPPSLLQWLRISQPGANNYLYPPPSAWTVVSHERVDVVLGPGYGTGLRVEMMVADQSSGLSQASFSYVVPELLGVSPARGPTAPGGSPTFVTMRARNLPWGNPAVQFYVFFGVEGDGSMNAFTGGAPLLAARGGALAGTNPVEYNLTFALPAGLGLRRRVELHLRDASSSGASDTIAAGEGLFDYADPDVDYLVYESAALPPWNTSLAGIVPPALLATARVITMRGTGFGPPAGGIGAIRRQVILRSGGVNYTLPASGTYTPALGGRALSFTDTAVTFVTPLLTGTAELSIQSSDSRVPAVFGAPLQQRSQLVDLAVTQMEIVELLGQPAEGWPTAGSTGNTPLGLVVPYGGIASVGVDLRVNFTVPVNGGGSVVVNGDVLNINWDASAAISAVAIGFRQPLSPELALTFSQQSCQARYGAALQADSLCRVWVHVPEGQGAGVPVRLVKDGRPSTPRTVDYAPPVLTRVTVRRLNNGGDARLYNNLPFDSLVLPTSGYELVLMGASLGLCPEVYVGDNRVDSCPIRAGPGGAALVTHTTVVVPVPPGEGFRSSTGANMTLRVRAGNQVNLLAGSVPGNITVRYAAPVVTGMTPTGPTRGGITVTLTGTNFGAPNTGGTFGPDASPSVTFVKDDGYPALPCNSTVRVSHTEVTCTLPAGSGAGLDARLCIAGQCVGSSAGGRLFSYERPAITDMVVDLVLAFRRMAALTLLCT
jgi:hypothetical protein